MVAPSDTTSCDFVRTIGAMPGETAGAIFAILLAVALLAVVGIRFARPAGLVDELRHAALALGALVAAGAMGGSLWFSERENFTPCELCWYQRIAMYPLVLLLGVGALRRDDGVRPYALALAGIGAAISVYHVQLQAFPDQGSTCSTGASCTDRWIEVFGFVSIPVLALASFTLILLLVSQPSSTPPDTTPPDTTQPNTVPSSITEPSS